MSKQTETLKLALEAGAMFDHMTWVERDLAPVFERFATLVAAAELDALEKIDWTALLRQGALVTWGDAETLGDRVIAAIRARGQA